jgi:hypothetical protein
MNAAGATTITVNTGLFAAGDTVFIQNLGAGACTVTAGTATVATAGSLILPQNDAGILYFTATGASIFYDFIQAGGASAFVGARVTNSTNTTFANATVTTLTFNTETYDTDNIHSTDTNTSRLTIPAGKDGYWEILGSIRFDASASGQRQLRLLKNGTMIDIFLLAGSSAADANLIVADTIYLVATDYVELAAYQSSGGNLNNDKDFTYFLCNYLGA